MKSKESLVRDYMTPEPAVVRPDDPVAAVRALMDRVRIECVPVVDATERLAGIVTSFDLMRNFVPAVKVQQVMTERVHTISPDGSVEEAARTMRRHGVHHLVVVSEGRVVGILSSFDLLRLLEDSPKMDQALQKR